MATVSDYIQASLRLTGILGESDSVSAEQGANGLTVLNDMIGMMRGEGIEIGIAPQSSTTATLLVPEEDRLGLKHIFAVYLCLNYRREVPESIAALGDVFYKKALRRSVLSNALGNYPAMPLGAASPSTYNILNGQ